MSKETRCAMTCQSATCESHGEYIINSAKKVKLDPGVLYEAVIDLSEEGILTANSINLAAGILLNDLGLPNYFFENITKESLKNILETIATSLKEQDGKVSLIGRVSHSRFTYAPGKDTYCIRIATEETRDQMEAVIGSFISGHRREYYYCPDSKYYTYLVRPHCIMECKKEDFTTSPFLFRLSDDYKTTPENTRKRYEKFLDDTKTSVIPNIEVFNLPGTGETRFMFISDFALPQLPVLRKLFEDNGMSLKRAYWEPYYTGGDILSSVCSLYTIGEVNRKQEAKILADLCSFLTFAINPVTELYVNSSLTFQEMLFAGNLIDFVHMFIYKENHADSEIFQSLTNADQKDAFANRLHDSNKSTYVYKTITEYAKNNVDLIKFLFRIFDAKFNPQKRGSISEEDIQEKYKEYLKTISIRFMEEHVAYEIFKYMYKFNTALLKTNFYKEEKRAYAFRFTNDILDPLVFNQFVYGIFFVNGHYACGTHLRAKDIARGGLRLLRITKANYGSEIDKALLLNYALGPKAQRLKHKDICESGSKGVVIPHAIYASQGLSALFDYTDGIMDLMLPSDRIVDYLGKTEMVFFGPDEGTAPMMDTVSYHARERGYKYWRTITTGKSFGIPHDVYGVLDNGDIFGLLDRGEKGTELQINGESILTSSDTEQIYAKIGGKIDASGMTTTCIMTSFRQMIAHYGDKEENLNFMMTGGPDGDLGSNQIQCYKGKICLIIDGGSILFDPNGLDKKELMKIAFMRHTSPRANSLLYPKEKLSKEGFMVLRLSKNVKLPDGTLIEDGAMFHKSFLTNPTNRKFIEKADIKAFIPCGGFKDTINGSNVKDFLANFAELKYIVEGANVFFDDSARRYIAKNSDIKHIKDSTANKGGVMSSSLAEVLTAFLLGDSYDEKLLNDVPTRWGLIKNVNNIIQKCSRDETQALIDIYEKNKKSTPLFVLSVDTSEAILSLQDKFEANLDKILGNKDIVWEILEHYIPEVLVKKLGKDYIISTLDSSDTQAYRNAILTKKLAAMAFYKYATDWDTFQKKVEKDFDGAVKSILS